MIGLVGERLGDLHPLQARGIYFVGGNAEAL